MSATTRTPSPEDFDTVAREILHHWGSPGTVVTVVRHGEVTLRRGYGETRHTGGRPVSTATLTSVASVTKTVNSVALAILVADGVLWWDEPVKRVVPEFCFADAYRTENTTLRDLVTHRAGLPGVMGDLWSLEYGIEELLADLPSAEPSTAFRETVEYSQVGIALLGEVVRRTSGMSWEDFVRTRITQPLAMVSTYPSTLAFLAAHPDPETVSDLMGRIVRRNGNYAAGAWRGAGKIYTPAGGIVTTGDDMTRFMLSLLSPGKAGVPSVLATSAISELHSPQAIERSPYGPIVNPFRGIVAYCMGWIAYDFSGHRVVEHPGSNFGSSVLALVPDAGVGVFVSTGATFSLDSDRLVSQLKFAAICHALGLQHRPWPSH